MKTINGDIYTNAANNLAVFEGSGVVSSEYSEPIVDTENMTVTVNIVTASWSTADKAFVMYEISPKK